MVLSNAAKAGAAIFVGAVQFGLLFVVSEILYSANGTNPTVGTPGYSYSVSVNYVSDLGATCSKGACYIPPSAYVFDSSIVLLGALTIVGAYFLHLAYRWKPVTWPVALAGVGALGVGLFPETTGVWHLLFSFVVFLFSGLSAVTTFRLQKKPMSYFSAILGVATLAALILYGLGSRVDTSFFLGLGPGGLERMVVYPVLLWAIGFGGHMMAARDVDPAGFS